MLSNLTQLATFFFFFGSSLMMSVFRFWLTTPRLPLSLVLIVPPYLLLPGCLFVLLLSNPSSVATVRDKKVLINQYHSPNAVPSFFEPRQYGKKKHLEVKRGERTIILIIPGCELY